MKNNTEKTEEINNNEEVKKVEESANENEKKAEEYKKFNNICVKIEMFVNDIVKEFFKKNKIVITEESYDIEKGTQISSKNIVVRQEHKIGEKVQKIFIGSEKIFDGDMIRYEILNPKEKKLENIKISIDEITNVETKLGNELLNSLQNKFVNNEEEEEKEEGYKKILDFMKKEELNKDDLLMALSVLFDEISSGNIEDDDNEKFDNEKKEIKELVNKHSETLKNHGEGTANLVKYKKSIFNKIIDWFYD